LETSRTRTLYRAVKSNPPTDQDYVTLQERKGDPPDDLPEDRRKSWDALSFYDTPEGVRRMAAEIRGPWKFVARYEISLDVSDLIWEESIEPGH
jgi:hypothetical protein